MTVPIAALDFDALRAELARTSISATTVNFIVWIDDVSFRLWVLERMTKILEKHPARAILLDACGDREPGARLVRSEPDDADTAHITVHGERVEIGVHGMSPADISELTSSLQINELPTLLWWTGEGIAEQPNFNSLVELADSLVVDSSGTRNDDSTVVELERFLSGRPTVGLRDLAWMRLRPWQDMIARFFDDPRLMEELYSVRSLKIVSGSDAEALYLAGWLGSRLGWTVAAHQEFSDRNGTHIPCSYQRAGRIRRVRSVEMTTTTSTYSAAVSHDDEGVVVVSTSGKAEGPARFVPLPAIDSPSLLERAILEPATDEVFETALRMSAHLQRDPAHPHMSDPAITVVRDPAELAERAADFVVDRLNAAVAARGRVSIALAGGSTPRAMNACLAAAPRRERVDWSRIAFYFGDERCVPPEHADSNFGMTRATLFAPLRIGDAQIFRIRGEDEPHFAADTYDALLRETLGASPTFDLISLGMGPDGHTASLFPGTIAALDTGRCVVANFVPKFDAYRVTITPPLIRAARCVLITAAGAEKADALQQVLAGAADVDRYPAQLLRDAADVHWLVDAAAAQKLTLPQANLAS